MYGRDTSKTLRVNSVLIADASSGEGFVFNMSLKTFHFFAGIGIFTIELVPGKEELVPVKVSKRIEMK